MGLSILERGKIKQKVLAVLSSQYLWAKLLGLIIPLALLLYILFFHYLPFGYHKLFILEVGSQYDTTGNFHIEPSLSLSERKTSADGNNYRDLNGVAHVVFRDKFSLQNPQVMAEVTNEEVRIIPPVIDFDPDTIDWDINWDFTKKIPKELSVSSTAIIFDKSTYLNGTNKLELKNSSSSYEEGPFTLFAEWQPLNSEEDFQEIVGHYNWELLQEKNKVRFMIGRMEGRDGPLLSIESPIKDREDFFKTSHTAIAIYSPDKENGRGYMELFVDNIFIGRKYFGSYTIWKDYNGDKNITLGKSDHSNAKFFKGYLRSIRISSKKRFFESKKVIFTKQDSNDISLSIVTETSTKLGIVKLHVDKK